MIHGNYLPGETFDPPEGVMEEPSKTSIHLLKISREQFQHTGDNLQFMDEVNLHFDNLGFYGVVVQITPTHVYVQTAMTREPWF